VQVQVQIHPVLLGAAAAAAGIAAARHTAPTTLLASIVAHVASN
jgi:hypothetical protein